MELLIILGVLVIVGSWVYFGNASRREGANQVAKKALEAVDDKTKKSVGRLGEITQKAITEASKVTDRLTQSSHAVLEKARIIKKSDGFEPYKQWVLDEKRLENISRVELRDSLNSFIQWFNDESNLDEQKLLFEKVVNFCKENRVKLEWIIDDGLFSQQDEMKLALEEVLLLQSLVWYKTRTIQPELELVQAYEIWRNDPYKGRNLEISQKMFAKMIDMGLVTASPELLLAPEKKRREYLVESVLDYGKKDIKSFLKTFREILNESKIAPQGDEGTPEEVLEGDVIESRPAQKRANRRSTE